MAQTQGIWVLTRDHGATAGQLYSFECELPSEDVPERECKRIMREILEAVDHIHSRPRGKPCLMAIQKNLAEKSIL